MSCADLCIDADYDGPSPEFYRESFVKARKTHCCVECGAEIGPGTVYQRTSGKWDGRVISEETCYPCAECREVFSCGGWTFGMFWEDAKESLFDNWDDLSPIDCLAKLRTKEAQDKAMEMYRKWQWRHS